MRVSIVIAAHNEGDALSRTVQSCVETCPGLDYEIVIADDASQDGSIEDVSARFSNARIVRHEDRQGASPTKALGAGHARGDALVFLDGHTKPEPGAIARLVQDLKEVGGDSIVTPSISDLDVTRWTNRSSQSGHGYFLDLESFDCGWLSLEALTPVRVGPKTFYESPALIGCALAIRRQFYDKLWGFDRQMRIWGVEDLDFGLKCWLLGGRILHDPEAAVGHRFRESFDNYSVPIEHVLANQLRMARKNFTHSVWVEWAQRCRQRHPYGLADHPEGLWTRAWQIFEQGQPSLEHERAYVQGHRTRDEFWYAERFGLAWPRLESTAIDARKAEFLAFAEPPKAVPSPGP